MSFVKSAFIVVAGAFLLRLGWAILIPVAPVSDSAAYDTFAQTLAFYGVYGWTPDQPSAFWPIGTSAIYAALYAVFGHVYTPVVALNIALSTGIVVLTIWLGRIFFGYTTAILAGGLMAIWPSEVAYVTLLASEVPFTFFVLLGLVAWFSSQPSNLARAAETGLAIGAASYVRPVALLLPIVFWLSATPDWQKLRVRLPMMLVAMIVMGLTVVPWSVRNTHLFGHFVLLSTNGGVVLWEGNNPNTTGSYMPEPAYTEGLSEYEREKVLSEEAKRYIMGDPIGFLLRTVRKAALLHVGETTAINWNAEGIKRGLGERALLPLKLLAQSFWTGVLLLSFAGLVIMARERGITLTLMHPIVLTWIYFTAVYAVTSFQDRFHFPFHPFIAMPAAIAVLAAFRRLRPNTKTALRTTSGMAAVP
jgi:4-amino-4-deoxy-L-arabinose transferase-like glycosyltransferase